MEIVLTGQNYFFGLNVGFLRTRFSFLSGR